MFEKYLERLSELSPKGLKAYTYRYVKEIIYDNQAETEYGTTREGYEKFKQANKDLDVSYSGATSLRHIDDCEGTVGYILETKESEDDRYNEIDKILLDAWEEFYIVLEVEDKESVKHYLDIRINADVPMAIPYHKRMEREVKFLRDFVDEYREDEEIKRFFDKIKKL